MDHALAFLALFSAALLFGGMVFFATVVAPTVFRLLPAEWAGRFVRGIFPLYYAFLIGTAAAGAVAMFPLSKPGSGILAVVAGMTVWLRQGLMPQINAASDRAQAGDAAAKRLFDRLHRLSVLANILQLVAAGAVLAMFVP
ncbi:MAG: DUF4149 domain-containing protein [Acetobacteraceae bacterium]|nr:DUF4149 domain-containing protein [Acetobacteraceae bacterium]